MDGNNSTKERNKGQAGQQQCILKGKERTSTQRESEGGRIGGPCSSWIGVSLLCVMGCLCSISPALSLSLVNTSHSHLCPSHPSLSFTTCHFHLLLPPSLHQFFLHGILYLVTALFASLTALLLIRAAAAGAAASLRRHRWMYFFLFNPSLR